MHPTRRYSAKRRGCVKHTPKLWPRVQGHSYHCVMKSSADTLSPPHPKPYSTLIFIHTFFTMAYIMRRGEGRKEVSAAGPCSHRALGTTRSCACRPHKKRALCVLGLIRTCLFTRPDKLVIYATKIRSYFVSCCHLRRGRSPTESPPSRTDLQSNGFLKQAYFVGSNHIELNTSNVIINQQFS